MTKHTIATISFTLSVALGAVAYADGPAPAKAPKAQAERVARGEYLVKTSACNDCHTPLKMGPKGPERDLTRLLSGHPSQMVMPPAPVLAPSAAWNVVVGATMTAWSGPWGTSFTANLTPDKETGLGGWTARNFIETIRNGRHQGRGRPLLPPMPWDVYANFTDQDLESIFAYLQAIPAVKNRVPQPMPPAAAAPVTAAK
jgi:mono/diheme cytochrome c family protein